LTIAAGAYLSSGTGGDVSIVSGNIYSCGALHFLL
jgi:hypothetical protein